MARSSATKDLVLESFGLPATFPADLMPERARQLVADAKKGMSASDLIRMAKSRGFRPLWKPLPHMVEADVFGLGLDVDGLQVPLMVKMMRLTTPEVAPVVQPTQESLF